MPAERIDKMPDHTITIPEALWDAYDRSPSKMRDTLWQAQMGKPSEETPPAADDFETDLVLRWDTRCSVCRKELKVGETAMFRVPATGGKQIICMDHGEEAA